MDQNIKHLPELNALLSTEKPKVKMLTGDGTSIWGMCIFLLLGLGILAATFWMATGVYEDYEIKQNYMPINSASIDGKCHSRLVFVDCDAKIKYQGKTYEKSLFFIDLSSGDYTVEAVRHADKPGLISIDLAVKKIPSRLLILAILSVIGIYLLYLFVYVLFVKRPRVKSVLREVQHGNYELALFPFDIVWWEKKKQIRYQSTINGDSKKMFYAQAAKKEKYAPYFFAYEDELCVIVVRNPDSGNFLVVDQGLNRFKMGKKERNQLIASLEALTQ